MCSHDNLWQSTEILIESIICGKMSALKLLRLLMMWGVISVLCLACFRWTSHSFMVSIYKSKTHGRAINWMRWSTKEDPEPQRIPWDVHEGEHVPRDYTLCIKMPLAGRLGNFMFVYASTLGIAYTQNYIPAIETTGNPLPELFNITGKQIQKNNWHGWDKFVEAHANQFDKRVFNLKVDKNQYLKGYYQSWKYFADPRVEAIVRREFHFKDNIFSQALTFVHNVTVYYGKRNGRNYTDYSALKYDITGPAEFESTKYYDNNTVGTQPAQFESTKYYGNNTVGSKSNKLPMYNNISSDQHTTRSGKHLRLVGIHVRRGDLPESYNRNKGYLMAPVSYIHKAMRYFEVKYNSTDLVFIICSDSLDWVKLNIKSQNSPLVISEKNSGEVDLAILTLCDDVIMTVGTFGWWAGWLAGGDTIYWKDFPKPHSTLAYHFNHIDYYPKHWIAMHS